MRTRKLDKTKNKIDRCPQCGGEKISSSAVCRICYAANVRARAIQKDRRCSRCGSSGPFNRNNRRVSGLSAWCKMCDNESASQWQKNNPSQARQRKTQWYFDNKPRLRDASKAWKQLHHDNVKESNYRRRAKKALVDSNLTAEEWETIKREYGYRCLACGRQEPGVALTIDHVIPLSRQGEDVVENIQPLCQSCNSTKHMDTTDFRPFSPSIRRAIQLNLFGVRT